MKISIVHSSVLNRPVFIADPNVATTFAEQQSNDTGIVHAAESVDVYEDSAKLSADIDQAHRDRVISRLTPVERRAIGLKSPEAPKTTGKPTAEAASENA